MILMSGLVAASAPGCTHSNDEAASQVSGDVDVGVPGEVYEVRTLGAWRDGSRAGTYRIVTLRHGFDHVQTDVVIQWMEQGLDQEGPGVVAARRLEVLDDLGPITVEVGEPTVSDGLSMPIHVKNVVSGEEGDVEAIVGAPGQLTAKYTPTGKR